MYKTLVCRYMSLCILALNSPMVKIIKDLAFDLFLMC